MHSTTYAAPISKARLTLFPIYVAALVWGKLFSREARLRALVPLRG